MTLSEMEARMGSGEFMDWVAYYNAEPFGAWRDNLHAGIVASAVWRAVGGNKSIKATDFILVSAEEKRKTSLESALGWFRAVAKRKD